MSGGKVLFSVVENEKLVEMVAKYGCLYDLSSPLYKDQIVKDSAWKEIAKFVGRSANNCKKRWRNRKDTYLKRKKKGKATGCSASSMGKKWPLTDMLIFLDQSTQNRQSTCNIDLGEDNIYEDNPDADSSTDDVVPPLTSEASCVERTESLESAPSFRPPIKRFRPNNDKIVELLEARRAEHDKIMNKLLDKPDDVDMFSKVSQ